MNADFHGSFYLVLRGVPAGQHVSLNGAESAKAADIGVRRGSGDVHLQFAFLVRGRELQRTVAEREVVFPHKVLPRRGDPAQPVSFLQHESAKALSAFRNPELFQLIGDGNGLAGLRAEIAFRIFLRGRDVDRLIFAGNLDADGVQSFLRLVPSLIDARNGGCIEDFFRTGKPAGRQGGAGGADKGQRKGRPAKTGQKLMQHDVLP